MSDVLFHDESLHPLLSMIVLLLFRAMGGSWDKRKCPPYDICCDDDASIFGLRTDRSTPRAPDESVTSKTRYGASQGVVDNVS